MHDVGSFSVDLLLDQFPDVARQAVQLHDVLLQIPDELICVAQALQLRGQLAGLGLALQNLAAQALRPFHTGVGVDPEEDEGACVGRRLSVPLLHSCRCPDLLLSSSLSFATR